MKSYKYLSKILVILVILLIFLIIRSIGFIVSLIYVHHGRNEVKVEYNYKHHNNNNDCENYYYGWKVYLHNNGICPYGYTTNDNGQNSNVQII